MDPPSDRPLRLLEVAALPFPSRQGTQALLREQCAALAERGHDVHLLVYAHGAYVDAPTYTVHRLDDWPRERVLRSGPSWRKVVLDLRMVPAVRRLADALRPDVIHAHNYEALAICLAARPAPPLVYHAHTLFGYELPTYGRARGTKLLGGVAGSIADRVLPKRADLTLAVSPLLVEELLARGHPADRLDCSLPGITIPEVALDGEGSRRQLGLEQDEVVGYCGNLDAYQGLGTLLDALAILVRRRSRASLLVITASESEAFVDAARKKGVADRVRVVSHGDFADALSHVAAAHVCVVPRNTPGGFPVKLLTYLAARRPVVTTCVGAAGLDLGRALSVIDVNDPCAMARALEWLLDHPHEASERGRAGGVLVRREFSWEVAGARLESQLWRAMRIGE